MEQAGKLEMFLQKPFSVLLGRKELRKRQTGRSGTVISAGCSRWPWVKWQIPQVSELGELCSSGE